MFKFIRLVCEVVMWCLLYLLKALLKSRNYLLQIATPDAVARSKFSKQFTNWDKISAAYFKMLSYSSLDGLLSNCLSHTSDGGVVIQITTHGALLQRRDLLLFQKSINFTKEQISFFKLQQFNTEMDFCNGLKWVDTVCVIKYLYV